MHFYFILTELESQLKQQHPPDLKREIMTVDGESSQRVRELEKVIRLLKQEKEEAQKVSITIFYTDLKVYFYEACSVSNF
jgi:tellurite resistance protein